MSPELAGGGALRRSSVNVESVAWITSGRTRWRCFSTPQLLWYLRFDSAARVSHLAAGTANGTGPLTLSLQWRWYWFSLAAFFLALLSKTVVAPMPLVLLGLAWWRRGGWAPDLWQSVPFSSRQSPWVDLFLVPVSSSDRLRHRAHRRLLARLREPDGRFGSISTRRRCPSV